MCIRCSVSEDKRSKSQTRPNTVTVVEVPGTQEMIAGTGIKLVLNVESKVIKDLTAAKEKKD